MLIRSKHQVATSGTRKRAVSKVTSGFRLRNKPARPIHVVEQPIKRPLTLAPLNLNVLVTRARRLIANWRSLSVRPRRGHHAMLSDLHSCRNMIRDLVAQSGHSSGSASEVLCELDNILTPRSNVGAVSVVSVEEHAAQYDAFEQQGSTHVSYGRMKQADQELRVKPLSMEEVTTQESQYSDVRGKISTEVRNSPGFVHIENTKGGFYAVSEESLAALEKQGMMFVQAEVTETRNNLAMYDRFNPGEYLDLPSLELRKPKRGIRKDKRQRIAQVLDGGTIRSEGHGKHSD